ncbi:MAG: hypothetical protein A3C80_03255 [Candidatus Ryanbacteria bacterium RIFCSPHIGHO2_02_FULL_45_43]|uniref:Methyltransferase domain-containing protein n=1 Tax=Candidatus Ryanbacteria bacterium RIFCSPHIGHO2_01_45_13 TaxID=1802112 RepID=A0A1G2FZ85_9BACT|nr:MAG: hypothetical protein A2718_03890 [Candidatus Ryanbacteria bacterium RIFCSPHIGHO2_01_FULL_44_130]OGZ43379.1 MAG: hypothetical protein A2W41_03885 [Candidatus Ryanbacteria bacterium RIFCSPHIGHO2_01_45_13]OGZ48988.1 MAG: hypothetical protein A3C80_03255 [Candidatus Ryanbacteria bacterium RIFCSPHIGHO2_02_FULL_45_43]OGZ50988.1 MAG: hypothetical protein A3E55_04520 [Candidatus Ryanbacteria bacterium RIFCSPHIGHO2_12_FULL_44_20]OGZ51524.1 MAG: hypothetical protein A3A17_01540 [Candidatus Ryanba
MKKIVFIKTFVKDKYVGAVAPTSLYVVKKALEQIDFSNDCTIVEYGPGSGVFTRPILKKMTEHSKFIAIETNETFIKHLNTIKDARLIIEQNDARNIQHIAQKYDLQQIDYVISGIPFTMLDKQTRAEIVTATHSVLRAGGSFLVYQYSPLMKRYLEKCFPRVSVRFIPFNIPSMFLLRAMK